MIYYLENIYVENFIVNLFLMYIINIFTKSSTKFIRIILMDIIESIYFVILIKFNINNITSKILLIIFISYFAYKPDNIKRYFKIILYYLFLNYLYLGIIIGITLIFNFNIQNIIIKEIVYISSAVILYLLNRFMWKMWKTDIKKDNLTYIINIKGQEIKCYVDTGNLVRNNEYNLDVIFLDKKWYKILDNKNILKNKIETNIHTVFGNNVIPGYIVNNINVYKKNKKVGCIKSVIISFSNQKINIYGEYSGLIGYNTYIENLEGAIL